MDMTHPKVSDSFSPQSPYSSVYVMTQGKSNHGDTLGTLLSLMNVRLSNNRDQKQVFNMAKFLEETRSQVGYTGSLLP